VAGDFNEERARNGVVYIENIERLFESGVESRRIQEELELLMRGTIISLSMPKQRQVTKLDTSGISFFASTSRLHDSVHPIAAAPQDKPCRLLEDMPKVTARLEALGMRRDLIMCFDEIDEYGAVSRSEVADFLENVGGRNAVWSGLEEIGISVEQDGIDRVIDLAIQRGGGIRSIRSIVKLIEIRASFGYEDRRVKKISRQWIDENL
jgi:hypothetical protein